jgi:hypothetical protein
MLTVGSSSTGATAPVGWLPPTPERIGTGWGAFTALLWPGDFSGDGRPDLLARQPNGVLDMYRGNGTGGWVIGDA